MMEPQPDMPSTVGIASGSALCVGPSSYALDPHEIGIKDIQSVATW
jgi:hypothetical protein